MESSIFDNIKEITVQRSGLMKWFMKPLFEMLAGVLLTGCFVRILVSRSTSGTHYRLLMVESINTMGQQYIVQDKATTIYLNCVLGDRNFTTSIRMTTVSDSVPLEKEFEQWVREVKTSNRKMLSKWDLLLKKEMLLCHCHLLQKETNADRPMLSLNIADDEKDRLRRELEVAKEEVKKIKTRQRRELEVAEAEVKRIKTRLEELEASRQTHQTHTKAVKPTEMKRKNRVDDEYDPFSRKWNRSREFNIAEIRHQHDAENVGTPVMEAAGMEAAGMEAAGMQAAGMEAVGMETAGMEAGNLVDIVAMHNFDPPISLNQLNMFRGAQDTRAAYMARKQKIEAAIGVQIQDDGREHPHAISIADYKQRRENMQKKKKMSKSLL